MTSNTTLADLAAALLAGSVRVVDLSAPLGPDTPVLYLPPNVGKNTPPVKVHSISNYDADGPFWAWNWIELGEHTGTHFDAPRHWISGKDYRDGATDTIPVKNFVAPVNVIDRSKETAANPDYLLTPDSIKEWEKEHGEIERGTWVLLRTDWYKRNGQHGNLPQRRRQGAAFAGSDRGGHRISRVQRHHRLGFGDGRHGRRLGRRHGSAFPRAHAHAQGQSLRPREPLPSRPAAAQRRGADRGAAEVRRRHRLSGSRARARSPPERRMASADYVIVGGGINGLVAAAMLGKKGRKVLLLERNDRLGGCLRTEEITAPGFIHDVMATTLVLFLTSPAYGAIGKDLEARGFAFAHTDLPTGVLRPDGSHVLFSRDRARNVTTFDACAKGDGAAFAREMDGMGADAPFLFALLGGRLWSRQTATLIAREAWRRGPRELAAWFGEALTPARHYLEATYASDAVHALWAPWGLHCGLNPESAYSAQMVKVIAFAVELAGCPIAVGGAKTLLAAFERLIADKAARFGAARTSSASIPRARRARAGRAACVGGTDRGGPGRHLLDDADQLYGGSARSPAPRPRPRNAQALSLRQGRHADPLCAEGAAALERRRPISARSRCSI